MFAASLQAGTNRIPQQRQPYKVQSIYSTRFLFKAALRFSYYYRNSNTLSVHCPNSRAQFQQKLNPKMHGRQPFQPIHIPPHSCIHPQTTSTYPQLQYPLTPTTTTNALQISDKIITNEHPHPSSLLCHHERQRQDV